MGKTQISIKCIIAICCIFCFGCANQLNKIYDYKPVEYGFNAGKFGAKLMGTFTKTKNETIKGSPYELFMWFESNQKIDGSVIVERLELFDKKTKEVLFHENAGLKKTFTKKSDKMFRAYFSFKDIDLKYSSYILLLSYKIKTENSLIDELIKLEFEKDYKEYRSNKYWQRIMGV